MEKYLNYYLSDSQHDIKSVNYPSVSYCALEDEIHYQKIPNITLEDFLESIEVSTPEDVTFNIPVSSTSGYTYLSFSWDNTIGVLLNQFEAYEGKYPIDDTTLNKTSTFSYNKIVYDNSYPISGTTIIVTDNILRQLDGKAKVYMYFESGD